MSQSPTVIGGTGYAGSAITAQAAERGHQVTALSRSLPDPQVPGVTYAQSDASHESALAAVIKDADVVAAALSPRGPLTDNFRKVYRTIARLADAANATLFVVGGFSSLRPSPAAPRFVDDLSDVPAHNRPEITTGAALIIEDLSATPATLDWVFVSPPLGFGSWVPGQRLGRYRLGDDVAMHPEDGGEISAADYALRFVDLIEQGSHHRAHLNLSH